MSFKVIATVKKLVDPYMKQGTIQLAPSDDGLHLTGYDRDGVWRVFTCISQALSFANEGYCRQHGTKARHV